MTVLTTGRLTLTPIGEEDFNDLKVFWSDPGFYRSLMPTAPTGEEVWTRLLRDVGCWTIRGYGNWAMRLRGGGDFVGTLGVLDYQRDIDPPLDAPELGWGLVSRFQGQGLAYEAGQAALDWCDHGLKAPRTVCIITPDNLPSLNLAARLGYTPYGEATFKGREIGLLERRARAA